MLIWILLSTIVISLFALIGALTLAIKEELLNRIIHSLIALSIGTLLGGAFLHLMPEAVEKSGGQNIFLYILIGFLVFFLIEKILHWRHCHEGRCQVHTFTYINLLGDGVHNLLDGIIIAAAFMVDIKLGLTTVLLIALHEIPQEIGDFAILIYGGFKKKKALLLNFLSAITVIIGGVAGYFFLDHIESSIPLLLAIAAGGFIYIAATDLIPEMNKETLRKKSVLNFIIILGGILLMYGITFIE